MIGVEVVCRADEGQAEAYASAPWCAETQTAAERLGRGLLAAPLQRVEVPSR
jgi:hypothetical protein